MPMRLLRQGATVPVVEWVESNRLSREGVAITKADCTRNWRSCIGNWPYNSVLNYRTGTTHKKGDGKFPIRSRFFFIVMDRGSLSQL